MPAQPVPAAAATATPPRAASKHTCSQCKQVITSESRLLNHMNLKHSGRFSGSQEFCKHLLEQHKQKQYLHGQANYKYPFMGCNVILSTTQALGSHIATHHFAKGENYCPMCP